MSNSEPTDDTQQPPVDVPLCSGCLSENAERADFCAKCGMPIGTFSTLDPIKQIYATGWMWRRVTSGRVPAIALLGMWLIFGPTLLLGILALIGIVGSGIRSANLVGWIVAPVTAIISAATCVILYRVTRNYFRYRAIGPGCCEECGREVKGLPDSRCPECETPFPAGDDRSLDADDN